ncbi:SurA N-terminal domain-containing protein [Candidatus Pandoraea novymonadis]|uniref:Periplasmic chaperone PpiD n=1 Tax=Candidatus Pandoraea novymonadis TaxID=1808959 RepID=A0ABX5FEX7_9BURK|nr:SurA N-terminal domain-containing protein [Candidatus Pandoraea novymonadis]PSB92253.1 Peptidyl-prolyl cis-trans isomerase D [Candidatus Pandoraea novymonadis]
MFDFIRRYKRLFLIFLGILIVPSFVLVGIHGFQESSYDRNKIAIVGNQNITRQELDAVLFEQTERMRKIFGEKIDIDHQVDQSEISQAVLDMLINKRLLEQEALKKHLSVSDEQVREALLSIPAITQLRKLDGSFDEAAYSQLLAAQQLTPQRLEEKMRLELTSQQLSSNLQDSVIVPKTVIDRFLEFRMQVREVALMKISSNSYLRKIHPTKEQLQAYYNSNKFQFQKPQSAKVEYVLLDPKEISIHAVMQPSYDDLKKYYKENVARFTTKEQRRVSHILISAPSDASHADCMKAKAKAEAILAQLQKHPNNFVKLAVSNSDDLSSKENGGDLGYFQRGSMVRVFEDTAFIMKDGDLSDVVKTDFGFHILKLTGIKPSQTKSFDEVKEKLVSEWLKQEQAKYYAKFAEQFRNGVYEDPDSLRPVAEKLGLKVQIAEVDYIPKPIYKQHPLNNEKLLRAIFSDEALKNKRNTEVVDIGKGVLVSARIVKYCPAVTPELLAVESQVISKLTLELAAREAKKVGEAKLKALKKGELSTGFGVVQVISRDNQRKLSPSVLGAIFSVDTKTMPAYVGVDLGKEGYAIYRISRVSKNPVQDSERIFVESQKLRQMMVQAEWNAYVASLRTRSKVKILTLPQQTS